MWPVLLMRLSVDAGRENKANLPKREIKELASVPFGYFAMWPVCFSILSGQDATLTVGNKENEAIHLLLGHEKIWELKWGGVGGVAAWLCFARLWTELASCEQMGGTQQTNTWCPVVAFKGWLHLLCGILSLNSDWFQYRQCSYS